MCINTKKRKEFLELFRPEFPASKAGVSGPWTCPRRNSKAAEVLLSPWCGAEFPALRTGVSAPGQTFRPQGTGVFAQVSAAKLLLSSWCGAEFPAPLGRSFRPRPEFPVTRTGNSGVILLCNGYFSGRGIYTPPSTSSQLAHPEIKIPIVASSRITRSPNPSTQTR